MNHADAITVENPLKFAYWLCSERGVIGADVDIDALWAQYVRSRACYHDTAVSVVEINRCDDCGALLWYGPDEEN